MKKILIAIMFTLSLLLVACSPQITCEAPSKIIDNTCCVDQNDNGVCDTEEKVEAEPEPEPAAEVQTEAEPEPEPEAEMGPEVQEETEAEESYEDYLDSLDAPTRTKTKSVRTLIQKAMGTTENYFYRYSGPGILQDEYWVRGDKLKMQIHEPMELDKFTKFNMVFVDRNTKKAEGYCETDGEAKCWGGHGPFDADTKRLAMTPKEWLAELGDEFVYDSQNKINDVLYHIVDYRRDDGMYRVHIESWKGWPVIIEKYENFNPDIGNPDERWFFDDMDIGSVMEEDVMPNRVLASGSPP